MIKSNVDWCAKLYSKEGYKGVQHFAMDTGTTGQRKEMPFEENEHVSSLKVRKGYTLEAFTKEGHNGHGDLMKRFGGDWVENLWPSLGQYNNKMASYTCSRNHQFLQNSM